MTPSEFKYWLEGFAAGIETPTKEQWAKVLEQVSKIAPDNPPVIIDLRGPPTNTYPTPWVSPITC